MVTLDKVRNVFGHRYWPSNACTQSANCHRRFSYFLPTYATLWPMVLVYNLSMDLKTLLILISYPPMLHYDLSTFTLGNMAYTRSMQNIKNQCEQNVCNYTNESWNLSQDYKLKTMAPKNIHTSNWLGGGGLSSEDKWLGIEQSFDIYYKDCWWAGELARGFCLLGIAGVW